MDAPQKATKIPGAVKATPIPQTVVDDAPAGMPNAIDIDPKALKQPVLTRQGWVVPPDAPKVR